MTHKDLHGNNIKLKFAKQSYISHITKLLTLLQPNKGLSTGTLKLGNR